MATTDEGLIIRNAVEQTSLDGTEMLPLDDGTATAKMVTMSTIKSYVGSGGSSSSISGVISHIEGVYATEDSSYVYLNLVSTTNYKFPDAFPIMIVLKSATSSSAFELNVTPGSNKITITKSTLTSRLSGWVSAEFYGKIVESKPLHYLYAYEQDDDGNTTIAPAISVNRYGSTRTLTIVPSWGYYISSMQTRKSGDKTLTEVTSTTITQPNYDLDFIAFMDILDSATVDVELGSGTSVNGEITDGNGHYIQVSDGHSETGYEGYKLSLTYVGNGNIQITKDGTVIETQSGNSLTDYVLAAGSYTFTLLPSEDGILIVGDNTIDNSESGLDTKTITATSGSTTYKRTGNLYKFTPSASGTYNFAFTHLTVCDGIMYLLDSSKNVLTYVEDEDGDPSLDYSLTSGTTYYIMVVDYYGESGGVVVKGTLAITAPTTQYKLQVAASPTAGGTVYIDTSGTTSKTVDSGTSVRVYAVANDGYTFTSWSDGGTASHDVTVSSNKTLTATFTEEESGDSGVITLDFNECRYADSLTINNQTTGESAKVDSSTPSATLAVTVGDVLVFSSEDADDAVSEIPQYFVGSSIGYRKTTRTVTSTDIGKIAYVWWG